jgi:hypothetical protein
MKADVWVEEIAIKDYQGFLKRQQFDKLTEDLLNRIIADEVHHVNIWTENKSKLSGKVQTAKEPG